MFDQNNPNRVRNSNPMPVGERAATIVAIALACGASVLAGFVGQDVYNLQHGESVNPDGNPVQWVSSPIAHVINAPIAK